MELEATPSHHRFQPQMEGTDFGSTLWRHKRGYNPEFFQHMNFDEISDDSDGGLSFLGSDFTANPQLLKAPSWKLHREKSEELVDKLKQIASNKTIDNPKEFISQIEQL